MYKRLAHEGEYEFEDMIKVLKDFAVNDNEHIPTLYVSTDSQIFKNKISYATTIIMHKSAKDGSTGAGGVMFYKKRKIKRVIVN